MSYKVQIILGFILGLLAPMLIFILIYGARFGNTPFNEFIDMVVTNGALAPMLALSVLANLVLFFVFTTIDLLLPARGIILATVLYGLVIIYIKLS